MRIGRNKVIIHHERPKGKKKSPPRHGGRGRLEKEVSRKSKNSPGAISIVAFPVTEGNKKRKDVYLCF